MCSHDVFILSPFSHLLSLVDHPDAHTAPWRSVADLQGVIREFFGTGIHSLLPAPPVSYTVLFLAFYIFM